MTVSNKPKTDLAVIKAFFNMDMAAVKVELKSLTKADRADLADQIRCLLVTAEVRQAVG